MSSEKLSFKNRALKKTNASMIFENDLLKEENKSLKEKVENEFSNKNLNLEFENEKLKKEVENLNSTLSKFVKGKETLDVILGKQRCVFDKTVIGFNLIKRQKLYQNSFVNSKPSKDPNKYGYQRLSSLSNCFVGLLELEDQNERCLYWIAIAQDI